MPKVSILHKKGDKLMINNYRPISILPVFSKIFERAIYDQLVTLIRSLLVPSQYGFLSKSSTELALLELKEKKLGSFNNEQKHQLAMVIDFRLEEHTSELQSRENLLCC